MLTILQRLVVWLGNLTQLSVVVWKPIETAPKKDYQFVILTNGVFQLADCFWITEDKDDEKKSRWVQARGVYGFVDIPEKDFRPTHWTESLLPPPNEY